MRMNLVGCFLFCVVAVAAFGVARMAYGQCCAGKSGGCGPVPASTNGYAVAWAGTTNVTATVTNAVPVAPVPPAK